MTQPELVSNCLSPFLLTHLAIAEIMKKQSQQATALLKKAPTADAKTQSSRPVQKTTFSSNTAPDTHTHHLRPCQGRRHSHHSIRRSFRHAMHSVYMVQGMVMANCCVIQPFHCAGLSLADFVDKVKVDRTTHMPREAPQLA